MLSYYLDKGVPMSELLQLSRLEKDLHIASMEFNIERLNSQ